MIANDIIYKSNVPLWHHFENVSESLESCMRFIKSISPKSNQLDHLLVFISKSSSIESTIYSSSTRDFLTSDAKSILRFFFFLVVTWTSHFTRFSLRQASCSLHSRFSPRVLHASVFYSALFADMLFTKLQRASSAAGWKPPRRKVYASSVERKRVRRDV